VGKKGEFEDINKEET